MMKTRYMIMGALSALLLGSAVYGESAKSTVSEMLIERAWSISLKSGENVKAWPWLPSYPVAKLSIPGQDSFVVMSGSSSAVMPYAPLWHEGSAIPGEVGVSFISGERTSHFSVLKVLAPGDRFEMVSADGVTASYQIEDVRVVDNEELIIDDAQNESVVILSTSYPIKNAMEEGVKNAMRFVVISRKLDEPVSLKMAGL